MISRYVKGRVAVYIDASNIYHSCKRLKWQVDYRKLHDYLAGELNLVSVSFYSAKDPNNQAQDRFLRIMENMGYRVRSKIVKFIKSESDPPGGFHKANCDVELTIDVDDLGGFDTLILASGDSDFKALIQRVKQERKWCLVISTKGHVAKELLDEAKFIDLKKLKTEIAR
ncbi:NYN domain-containing protein [Candidatus Poribacteria bacterium]|nr:NYN domain-containing protein [Candidatus Poribacteria bacterium]